VSEVTLNNAELRTGETPSRAALLRRMRTSDALFHGLTRAAAIAVLLLLSGVIASLVIASASPSSPPSRGTR
jgi:phosphate transport system permease protein